MKPGDRIIFYPAYIEPGRSRLGVIKAITGASALILFDDCGWVQGAPLARLEPWTPLAEEEETEDRRRRGMSGEVCFAECKKMIMCPTCAAEFFLFTVSGDVAIPQTTAGYCPCCGFRITELSAVGMWDSTTIEIDTDYFGEFGLIP